jgi:hypothetical protein
MKYQIIAGAGLAAVIAFCGYMIAHLDANRMARNGNAPLTFGADHP